MAALEAKVGTVLDSINDAFRASTCNGKTDNRDPKLRASRLLSMDRDDLIRFEVIKNYRLKLFFVGGNPGPSLGRISAKIIQDLRDRLRKLIIGTGKA